MNKEQIINAIREIKNPTHGNLCAYLQCDRNKLNIAMGPLLDAGIVARDLKWEAYTLQNNSVIMKIANSAFKCREGNRSIYANS